MSPMSHPSDIVDATMTGQSYAGRFAVASGVNRVEAVHHHLAGLAARRSAPPCEAPDRGATGRLCADRPEHPVRWRL